MRFFVLLYALVLLALACSANAHDVGVSEVSLTEIDNGRYKLARVGPVKQGELMPAPRAPNGCSVARLTAPGENPVFELSCHKSALSAGDVLELHWNADSIVMHAKWLNGASASAIFLSENQVIRVPLADLAAASGDFQQAARRYAALGIEHIAFGVDHLLFVLGLMLLVDNRSTLIKAITAFTLAHSMTLALSFLDVITLDSAPVEASIALSLVLLAYEAIRTERELRGISSKWPWLVAGGFGLIHGLGFAAALKGVGVPVAEITLALLFFNMGVEFGQLAFILVVLCVYALISLGIKFHGVPWLTVSRIRLITAYAIGSLAMYWTIERSVTIFA